MKAYPLSGVKGLVMGMDPAMDLPEASCICCEVLGDPKAVRIVRVVTMPRCRGNSAQRRKQRRAWYRGERR